MNEPILHPKTHKALYSYASRPSHGLLLVGQPKVGKLHIAQWLAEQIKHDSYIVKKPDDKSTISIDQVRELYHVTRAGTPLTIIIKDSHLLGTEAQNAFLKLLEEPPQNTLFILTATSSRALLPTIRSRAQQIEILKPETSELKKLAGERMNLSTAELDALILTTRGRVGYFSKLLQDNILLQNHLQKVDEAKHFYSSDVYTRLLLCQENKYDKLWAEQLLQLLAVIIESLLKRSQNNPAAIPRLSSQAELIEEVSYALLQINGNPKIHLAKLAELL